MAEESTGKEAVGTSVSEGVPTAPPAFPGPRGLEAVFLHHREHARRGLFVFLGEFKSEVFCRPVECLAGRSIRDRLVHIIDTERFWVSLLSNRQNMPLDASEYVSAEAVYPLSVEASDRTLAFLHTVDPSWFVRENLFPVPGGAEPPLHLVPSLAILHILTHEFHHKGQILAAARSIGIEPPDLDFI